MTQRSEKARNTRNEPNESQVATIAYTVPEIQVKSKTRRAAALDNVARFLKRTEIGRSWDRRRIGTTKNTKDTKMDNDSSDHPTTHERPDRGGQHRVPKTHFIRESRPRPKNEIRAQHRLFFFPTFRVFRVFRGSLC
jgi:hypothetical protein